MSDYLVIEVDESGARAVAVHLVSGGGWAQLDPENLAARSDKRAIFILDGRAVSVHAVEIPDIEDNKATKILPAIMDDKIATHTNDVHYALVGDRDKDSGIRPVAAVDRLVMNNVMELAASLGITPNIIVPDFLILPVPAEASVSIVLDDRSLVRLPDQSGFALEAGIVSHVTTGAVTGESWHDLVASELPTLGSNLMQGPFAPHTSLLAGLVWWRRSAILGLLALVVLAGGTLYRAGENYRQVDTLYANAEEVFRTALPEERRIVNMEAQMRRALVGQRQQGGGEFFVLADVAMRAVEAGERTLLETVRYDRGEGLLILDVSFASFAESTDFRNRIEEAGMIVTEGSSRQEGNRVISEIRVRRS